ncbi:MAG: hypothetical protein LC721_05845 [Actinobacteria bacterium]|nr:hypothetical protein [Actinomycetota bacterium]
MTKRSAGDVWSYPNVHGDVIATADSAGAKQGSMLSYDPYGQALNGVPDNFDYGCLGQHQRGLEHSAGIATIEMGARQYVPGARALAARRSRGGRIGERLRLRDGDPVNGTDFGGTAYWGKNIGRHQAWSCKFHWKRCLTNPEPGARPG